MKLETIEQKCISYLTQTSNPLVPITTLLEFLRRDDAELSESQLTEFLQHHGLFAVIAPPGYDAERAVALAEAGIPMGPRVLLRSRIPSATELSRHIMAEVDKLTDALSRAMAIAKEQGEPDRARTLMLALARAEELKARMAGLIEWTGDPS